MAEASYKIKRILWPPWAEGERSVGHVGILCQDINGPCPLLAILNVLLLRGSISLPSDAGEITEVSWVVGNSFDDVVSLSLSRSLNVKQNLLVYLTFFPFCSLLFLRNGKSL